MTLMGTNGRQQAPTPGLGKHSARGMAYLVAGSASAIVLNFAATTALSYLLSPDDFGVVAIATTIALFIQLFEQGGVGDLLVQRNAYRGWAIPAFWLALLLGVGCSLAILIAAPIAAAIYQNQQLMWVLFVLAPASIFNALTVVPRAQLSRQLRFRALAAVNLTNLAIKLSLTVFFAWLGFGPFSYVLPVPITYAIMAGFLWWRVRPPWKMRLHLHRWKFLVGDSSRILTTDVQRVVLDQSDYFLLGLFQPLKIVGLYWFGFCVSVQLLQLLSLNMMGVLFPALTKLNDQPQQQFQGFLKAQRILAMFGISACLLQAAVSEPVTRLFLAPKWIPSIIVMQILCIGMATRMVAASSLALMKSQGRFSAIVWNRWGLVALQVTGLLVVLSLGGGMAEVAAVVAVVSTLTGLVTFYLSIKPYGAGWANVFNVLARPMMSAIASVGTAWLIAQAMASHGYGSLPQLIVTIVIAVGLSVMLARFWMRPVWDELWMRVGQLLEDSQIPRFSLRTLLITMTIAAVSLGLVVYAIRK